MNPLEYLPHDVILVILRSLDVRDIYALCETCRDWYYFIRGTDCLWRDLCRHHCDWSKVMADRSPDISWKELFQRHYGRYATKRLWTTGMFSSVQSYNDLPNIRTCAMDKDAWGDILHIELNR